MILFKNKRGQARIITVILLILIVIVAIVILWNSVILVVKKGSKGAGMEKFTINLKIENAAVFPTGAVKVQVTRESGKGKMTGLVFVFYNSEGNSKTKIVKDPLKELESKTYSFSPIPELGKIVKVSVAPLISEEVGFESNSVIANVFEIPAGLVSWWRLDSDAKDFVDGNNGSINGNFNFISDPERNKVASLKGGFISVSEPVGLDINPKFAISFWLKTTSPNSSLIKKDGAYEISLNNYYVNFSYVSSSKLYSLSSFSDLTKNEWHHIIITADWTGNQNIMIYIDGELDKMESIPFLPDSLSSPLFFGKNLEGELDEIMFFNRSISYNEALSIYQTQK